MRACRVRCGGPRPRPRWARAGPREPGSSPSRRPASGCGRRGSHRAARQARQPRGYASRRSAVIHGTQVEKLGRSVVLRRSVAGRIPTGPRNHARRCGDGARASRSSGTYAASAMARMPSGDRPVRAAGRRRSSPADRGTARPLQAARYRGRPPGTGRLRGHRPRRGAASMTTVTAERNLVLPHSRCRMG